MRINNIESQAQLLQLFPAASNGQSPAIHTDNGVRYVTGANHTHVSVQAILDFVSRMRAQAPDNPIDSRIITLESQLRQTTASTSQVARHVLSGRPAQTASELLNSCICTLNFNEASSEESLGRILQENRFSSDELCKGYSSFIAAHSKSSYAGNVKAKFETALSDFTNSQGKALIAAIDCINELQQIDIQVTIRRINPGPEVENWVNQVANRLNSSAVSKLPLNNQFQVASLLVQFASHIPQEKTEQILMGLSNAAIRFFSKAIGVTAEPSSKDIQDFADQFSQREEKMLALSCLINTKKLRIQQVLDSKAIGEADLSELGPGLKYANFGGVSQDTDYTLTIRNYPGIYLLKINACKITEISNLPALTELFCDSCWQLGTISHLPALTKLICPRCQQLGTISNLPALTDLGCQDCQQLGTISNLPALTRLDCYSCQQLGTISNLPALTRLDCYSCQQLGTISNLPALTELFCPDCPQLHAISNFPALTKLNCARCPQLHAISNFPALTELNCARCPQLHAISNLPALTELTCFCCQQLSAISNLPALTKLICTDCEQLGTISNLPALIDLNCSECPQLVTISNLGALIYLDCPSCQQLGTISNLPALTQLTCYSCQQLDTISNLPALTYLNCHSCPQLVTISNLGALTRLDCSECPLVVQLPQLAPYCHLSTSGNNLRHTQLHVQADFSHKPKKYLLELGQFIVQGRNFPSVYYYNEQGQMLPAIDAGGVRRDFVTQLFAQLFSKNSDFSFESADGFSWPQEDNELACRTLGALFARCLTDTQSHFLTGLHFAPLFFEILNDFAMSTPVSQEQLEKAKRSLLGPKARDIDENTLQDYIKEDQRLKALVWIASELRKQFIGPLWHDSEQLSIQIQGTLSEKALLAKLDYRAAQFSPNQERARGFLETWIKQHPDKLGAFVQMVTGNPTLGTEHIKVFLDESRDSIKAATCFFSLYIPCDLQDQESFNMALDDLISTTFNAA